MCIGCVFTRNYWQVMELRILVGCVLLLAGSCAAMLPVLTHVHSKFEYKYSFKGPYLVNSQGNVPYWNHGGSEDLCALGHVAVTSS